MHRHILRLIVVSVIVARASVGYAQESGISGTVRDNTGGVLPGVTVTATNEASGTTFVSVTDERGLYRLLVRPGRYRLSAELTGFRTLIQAGVELLLGQQAVLNLEMAVSTVEESVLVTAEAPLLDVTSSTVSGNIDPRQMQELPLNGRNWMDLSLLAPGSRTNAATEVPQDRQGYFQINVDGQQVTFTVCCSQQQPRYSRDVIAEFEIATNRFDATKGRTAGMMVNAITKSGTNTPSGTLSGYFRDDRFNAKDFIQNRVLPYSNQQISGTVGGPIRRDRIHFFASYEYEREPQTVTFSSPFPSFNIDLRDTRWQHTGSGKADVQFSPRSRVAVRYSKYHQFLPNTFTGGATNHPSTATHTDRVSDQLFVEQNQVLSNRTVNQVKGGWAATFFQWSPLAGWGPGRQRPPNTPDILDISGGTIVINFVGYNFGFGASPQNTGEKVYSLRDDLTTSFDKGGRHDVKLGGEYIYYTGHWDWCVNCNGTLRAVGGPIPANIEALFPVWDDASTWNLAPLSPIVVDYRQGIGDFSWTTDRHVHASWLQDDWAITNRLTLNLGVRYDVDIGVQGEKIKLLPWLTGDRPSDTDNIAPRLGFAFQLNDRTVIRGGYGKFFTQLENDAAHQSQLATQIVTPEIINDGRPDFAANPWNGPPPSFSTALANACDQVGIRPGCFRRSISPEIPMPGHQISFSHMASLGVQRQLGPQMAFEANYVWTGGRFEERNHNINLSYNPATGANYPFGDLSRRPFPDWGLVLGEFMEGTSDYHGLETSFTKRFSNRWQANATYTLAAFWDEDSPPPIIALVDGRPVRRDLGFSVAPDLGGEYTLAATDQRHRATFNGIWDMGLGFQLSGLYFFGSGQRFATNFGGDQRGLGTGGSARLRPNGTIVPRNNFVGKPVHRVDMRLQKRLSLGGRRTIDGLLEVFNVFNHENFGSYTTSESNRAYGQPSFNSNVAFQARILQLGFRFAF